MGTKANLFEIDDLFHSPQGNISRLAEMQVHLYRHEPALQDYFYALDLDVFGRPRDPNQERRRISKLKAWSVQAVGQASRFVRPRRIKTDVLYSPTLYFGRNSEVSLLKKTLFGLAEAGAEVLCLLPVHAPFRQELTAELEAAGYAKQVTFLDPAFPMNQVDARTRPSASRSRGHLAFAKAVEILEPHGLTPTRWALPDFERSAEYIEAWERLAPSIEFGAVVARCHWYDLSSPICRTGLERGGPVITFQQGVVDHTLDVPITASKFVAFGASSVSVLAEANRRFSDAVRSPKRPAEYIPAGSLFDVITKLPDQFSLQSLLLVDSHSVARDPWGTGKEAIALVDLAERVLKAKLPLKRLIIRPHPHWTSHDLSACLRLGREYRDVCELSHPVWPLEDDLGRATMVAGIASGVLTVASASGLPTIFLRTEGGFRIQDLECFAPEQTLLPDEAFRRISQLLTDHDAYAEARETAMRNAGNYYEKGANAVLNGAFFTSLLNVPMKAVEDDAR